MINSTKPASAPKRRAPGRTPAAAAKTETKQEPITAPPQAEVPKKRLKVVRDSFSMPKIDHDKIDYLKKRFVTYDMTVKKNELLRAGLRLLERLDDTTLLTEIGYLENVRTGRPAAQELQKGQKTRKQKK